MKLPSRLALTKARKRRMSHKRRFLQIESLETRQLLAGDIVGAIHNDVDGNGARDQGEHGLAGWTVFLDSNLDGVMDSGEPSAVTDADGAFLFSGVPAGDYRVAEVVRSGWTPTNPTSGFVDVTVVDNESIKADFLNQGSGGTAVITGNVWRDLDGNGVQDAEDTGVAGWTVFLDLDGDKVLSPEEPFELTDGNGDYTFTGVLGGGVGDALDYEVVEVLTPGWEAAPGFSEDYTAAAIEGETTVVHDFANSPVAISRINGNVWNDVNANGLRDGGEPGLSGWTVFADLNTNNVLDAGERSDTTDASGNYSLLSLEPGSVRIAVEQQIDFTPTLPATGYQTVVAPNDGTRNNVNFGNKQRTDAAIGGVIYVDRDHDGVRDPGEEGLPGITVYIDDNSNGSLDVGEKSTVTAEDLFYTPDIDEAGTYRFDHLAGGTYLVRQIVPIELSSTPEIEREHEVTVGSSDDRSDVDSGDRYRPSEIHGFKFEDVNGNHLRDADESGIEGVTIFIDLDRDNVYDEADEPATITAADGSYSFIGLAADAYVVREVIPSGFLQTYPETEDGILWPEGVSNSAVGDVTPLLIETSLDEGETYSQTVSLTLPTAGALTNLVDVFLLFDDTGSFTSNSPIVRAAFPDIISQLQTKLPGIDLGFGVGRLEEYGGFASEYSTGRPFILNQPIIAADVAGFSESIQSALDHVAPGYGGDQPETVIEALYQMVTGAGFDGNDNGSVLDSGPAGLASTQVSPGSSGDVPSFASFTADPANGVLPATGSIGGAGFRSGALPIIITATDTGFAYQPKGETDIVGVDGLTLPVSQLAGTSRGTTPFDSGAGIQETITGLNALGALVIGLGTNDAASVAPREGLEALASLTGAINHTTTSIANGTADPIDTGDPFYFKIGAGGDPLVLNIADGIVAAIDGAVTAVSVNVTLRASDPYVDIVFSPGVINGLGAGDTATFDVTFTGDGRPHRFDLEFVREGTDVVLGSIPVVLGTPISGDGYEFEDCHDGEYCIESDFGNQRIDGAVPNVAPSFTIGADQIVDEDSGAQTLTNWATNISPGPASEAGQQVDFIVSNDNAAMFASQPAISADGTLTYTSADDAAGSVTVTVRLHDDGGTATGGVDTSAAQTFTIDITAVNDTPVAVDDVYTTNVDTALTITAASLLGNDSDVDGDTLTIMAVGSVTNGAVADNGDGTVTYTPSPGFVGQVALTYTITDGAAESTATVIVAVGTPTDAYIDFDDYTILSYGGPASDVEGTATVEAEGATLHLVGNLLKAIALPYTVTVNTVVEFDFRSPVEGEVHAVGTNINSSDKGIFKVYGTRPGAFTNLEDYSPSAPDYHHYQLHLGDFGLGEMAEFWFMNDHDVVNPDSEGYFANLRIFEGPARPFDDIVGRVDSSGDWWVARSNGTSFANEKWGHWSTKVTWQDVLVGDFNGDGKNDVVGRVSTSGDWWVAASNGTAFDDAKWGHWSAGANWQDVQVGDFNGDGMDDIVGRVGLNGDWWVAESNGTAFVNTKWGHWSAGANWQDVQVGDFDGDGMDDLVGRVGSNGNWWVAESSGTVFVNAKWGHWSAGANWVDVKVGDFDGDGSDDIAGRVSTNGNWWVARADAGKFVNEHWGHWSTIANWVDVATGDFNGDGKTDLMGRVDFNGDWWVAESSGTAFVNAKWGHWSAGANWVDVQVGDFNGDGNDDIAGRVSTNGNWWVARANDGRFINERWGRWSTTVDWVDVQVGNFDGGVPAAVGALASDAAAAVDWYWFEFGKKDDDDDERDLLHVETVDLLLIN